MGLDHGVVHPMCLSVRGKSPCASEQRGVRGLRQHAECPQVADTVIEANMPQEKLLTYHLLLARCSTSQTPSTLKSLVCTCMILSSVTTNTPALLTTINLVTTSR